MHQPLGGITGGAADIAIQAEQFALIREEMFRLNAELPAGPFERIGHGLRPRPLDSVPLRSPRVSASSTTSSPARTSLEGPVSDSRRSSLHPQARCIPLSFVEHSSWGVRGVQPAQQACLRRDGALSACRSTDAFGQRHHGSDAGAESTDSGPRHHHVASTPPGGSNTPSGDSRHHAVRCGPNIRAVRLGQAASSRVRCRWPQAPPKASGAAERPDSHSPAFRWAWLSTVKSPTCRSPGRRDRATDAARADGREALARHTWRRRRHPRATPIGTRSRRPSRPADTGSSTRC